jgi:HPt (histidine-containing phosphotransfer) domain-containing protein
MPFSTRLLTSIHRQPGVRSSLSRLKLHHADDLQALGAAQEKAHSLKGAAANLSALELAALFAEIEKKAAAGPLRPQELTVLLGWIPEARNAWIAFSPGR